MLNALVALLRRRGVASPQELQRELGISQPSFSRLVARGLDRIAVLGRGKATRYALLRDVRSLGAQFPFWRISDEGKVQSLGTLRALEGGRWWCHDPAKGQAGAENLFEGMPYFLADLRPQGFMGRAFPKQHADLALPERIGDWNDDDVLTALLRRGEDVLGNLLLGAESMQRFLQSLQRAPNIIPEVDRGAAYAQLAADALKGAPAGSSAGGEQPKFSALVERGGVPCHVLVKFSPPVASAADQRWTDLLFCEHTALEVLREARLPAVQSRILSRGERIFLEVARFDRSGTGGRIGTVSLGAFDDEFYGRRDNWTAAAGRLQRDNRLGADDARALRVLDAFGSLIGNTDRHFGNISLILQPAAGVRLAPAYDMLPMLYAPINGQIVERAFHLEMPHPDATAEWKAARPLAERFWTRAANDPQVSQAFRDIARSNAAVVAGGRAIADSLPDLPTTGNK